MPNSCRCHSSKDMRSNYLNIPFLKRKLPTLKYKLRFLIRMVGVMGVIIGLVIGVIGLVIVQETITAANFTSGSLLDTVTTNIPILFAVGLLVLAVSWAALR